MPKELESAVKITDLSKSDNEYSIFESKDEMRKSLSRLCYGNLYVIGSIWVEAMRTVLVGSNMCLVPTVHAAKKEEPPKKPPKMKYKDLPIYERPHHDYKIYTEDKEKCAEYKVKMMHKSLLPCVSYYRKVWQEIICESTTFFKEAVVEMVDEFGVKKKQFKSYVRDPQKLFYRQVAVIVGTAAGFYLGSRKKGYLYRRFFFAGVGALATGFLCFPKETDKTFRDVCYETAKIVVMLYNLICTKSAAMPPHGPCETNKPKEPEPRKTKRPCPEKK